MSATDKEEIFLVEITQTDCEGATIGEKRATAVTITNDENFNSMVDNMMDLTESNLEDLNMYSSNWGEMIKVRRIQE